MIFQLNTDIELDFAFNVKAMNKNIDPQGLGPSALVFGKLTQHYVPSKPLIARFEFFYCINIAESAGNLQEVQMSNMKLKNALIHAITTSTDRAYQHNYDLIVLAGGSLQQSNRRMEYTVELNKKLAKCKPAILDFQNHSTWLYLSFI